MKKEEAVESVERAGQTINGLYVRAWDTALHPTEHGWEPGYEASPAACNRTGALMGRVT